MVEFRYYSIFHLISFKQLIFVWVINAITADVAQTIQVLCHTTVTVAELVLRAADVDKVCIQRFDFGFDFDYSQ